jgi:predicted DNA-binding protein with PD1-like motif
MKYKLIYNGNQKTFAAVLDTNDKIMECLLEIAAKEKLDAAQFTAIGAFSELTIGFFDFSIKDYIKIEIKEQLEVLSIVGDISLFNNEPQLHAHIVVGKRDGTAHGGHLIEGIVHPTLEIIINESPAHLRREKDEATGLPLIKLGNDDSN